MEIQVQVGFTKEASAILERMIALNVNKIATAEVTTEKTEKETKKALKAKKAQKEEAVVEEDEEEIELDDEDTEAEAEAEEDEDEEEVEAHTAKEVLAAAMAFVKRNSREHLAKVLKSFKVAKVGELKETDYAKFMAKVK